MELSNVVDKHGNRTGRIVEHGTMLSSEEFYSAVHVSTRDENNNYIIQPGALDLESGSGVWCPSVRCAISGEENIDGATGKVNEELGLQLPPTHQKRIDRQVLDFRLEEVWRSEIPRDSMGTSSRGYEVADYKWVSRDQLEELIK